MVIKVTDILSPTVLKLSQLIVQISDTFRFYCSACNADAVLWWEFCLSVCQSVRLSVCLTHAWILTKRKKDLSRFVHHIKEHLA